MAGKESAKPTPVVKSEKAPPQPEAKVEAAIEKKESEKAPSPQV